MIETYSLRLSKHDPEVSNTGFIAWLKGKGHQVSLVNDAVSTVNGIPVSSPFFDPDRHLWAFEVLFDLLAEFSDEMEV